jgi:hypothetical protein
MRGLVATVAASALLLAGCTADHVVAQSTPAASLAPSSASSQSAARGSGDARRCPWAATDYGISSPTFITPTNPRLRFRIDVLARTTRTRSTTAHALVTALPGERSAIATLVRSRIVLVSQVYETVPKARGAVPPISPDPMLDPANVIAWGPVVTTTDTKNHVLAVRVPAGLAVRDYFVVGVQDLTPMCTPRESGRESRVIGLVRVRSS